MTHMMIQMTRMRRMNESAGGPVSARKVFLGMVSLGNARVRSWGNVGQMASSMADE